MLFEAITLYPHQKCAKIVGRRKFQRLLQTYNELPAPRFRRIDRHDCDLGVQRGWSPKALPARAADLAAEGATTSMLRSARATC
jgi:hypothetical protein